MAGIVTFFTVLFKIWLAYLEAFYRLIFPRPRKSIEGKVVLITGAGQGIGKCLALQFGEIGAKLALWDINEKGVQETAKQIANKGGTAFAYKCDVSNPADVKLAAARVRQNLDHVDIVVNDAGIMICKPFLTLTETEIRRTMDINTLAHFWINREFLPGMLERNYGHIVTISSMAGKSGTQLLTDYCASKFAVFGLAEALRVEIRNVYKKDGVKTTTVCPMFVNTNMISGLSDRATYSTGLDPIMEAGSVAALIVDGVLRDKYEIYIPAAAGMTDVSRALMPKKALRAIVEAIGVGFKEKTQSE